MKIKSIKNVGKMPVYDISVQDNEQYALENGVISHNTGSYYGADNIWILGRQQEKEDNRISGYNFIINVEKSRFVKEKSKIAINVTFDGGINRWSGLLDVALEAGFVNKPKKGYYQVIDPDTGEVVSKEMKEDAIIDNDTIWKALLEDDRFTAFIRNKYKLSTGTMFKTKEVE